MSVYLHGVNSGCYYITKDTNGSIQCKTLDSECQDKKITDVDFLKIDTEGSELMVLQGAEKTIKKWYPFIQIESNGLSEKLYHIKHSDIESFLQKKGYILYAITNNSNYFYYHPDISLNILHKNVFCVWSEDNKMSENRRVCLDSIVDNLGSNIILVAPDNLDQYVVPAHPLHPAYKYLSATHKSDYLRTYFMHFFGGGYTDIKRHRNNWSPYFEILAKDDNTWICGYREGGEDCIGYRPYAKYWNKLIGNGCYICKPNTPLTRVWYSEMIKLLDGRLEELKKHPATHIRDHKDLGTGYPIEWNEVGGRIFHRISYDYVDHINQNLPACSFENYL